MTSADSAAPAPPSATELFLPVGEEVFARPFDRTAMGRAPASSRPSGRASPLSHDRRVRQGRRRARGRRLPAPPRAASRRRSRRPKTAPPALTYLAATFAASGHDREAASAWQTALIDGAEIPEIYQWLGDTLLRVHDLPHARAVLEEAVGKWPTDPRFAKPLAMLYATMGLGREAVRTHAAPSGGAACRRRRLVHGRRVDLQPAHARRRGPVEAPRI